MLDRNGARKGSAGNNAGVRRPRPKALARSGREGPGRHTERQEAPAPPGSMRRASNTLQTWPGSEGNRTMWYGRAVARGLLIVALAACDSGNDGVREDAADPVTALNDDCAAGGAAGRDSSLRCRNAGLDRSL